MLQKNKPVSCCVIIIIIECTVDHSPIMQTFKFENNFSTVGKSLLNLLKL